MLWFADGFLNSFIGVTNRIELGKCSMPASMAYSRELSPHFCMSFFCKRVPVAPLEASFFEHSSMAPSSIAASTAFSMKPQSWAARASIASLRERGQDVRPQPIRRGNKAASATDRIFNSTSSIENFALLAQMRRLHPAASSSPPLCTRLGFEL